LKGIDQVQYLPATVVCPQYDTELGITLIPLQQQCVYILLLQFGVHCRALIFTCDALEWE
jgi:hypothetical protein